MTGGDAAVAGELQRVYGDVERVDLMVGLYAEPKPEGFGFSDTAFRVFILMASRRLEADRFFTDDYRPEVYTKAGIDWVESNSMRTVLLRHCPELAPSLEGVANPFAPWKRAAHEGTRAGDLQSRPRQGRARPRLSGRGWRRAVARRHALRGRRQPRPRRFAPPRAFSRPISNGSRSRTGIARTWAASRSSSARPARRCTRTAGRRTSSPATAARRRYRSSRTSRSG